MAALKRWCILLLILGIAVYVTLPYMRNSDVITNANSFPGKLERRQSLGVISASSGASSQPHQSRVIILAYMRTGSSTTGNIFNSHPDVFYWYEPLHSIGQIHSQRNLHLSKMERHSIFIHSSEVASNLSAVLSCDVKHVFWRTLTDSFMLSGRGTRAAFPCFVKGSSADFHRHPDPRWKWSNCAANLTKVCRKDYSTVAAKVIRLSLSSALQMMRRDPHLRVVHLVRDPRGILESRRRLSPMFFTNADEEARELCARMSEDLNLMAGLREESLMRRYMLIRYEDMATNPLEMAKMLYRFAGLSISPAGLRNAQKTYRMPKKLRRGEKCPLCPHNTTIRVTPTWGRWSPPSVWAT